MRRLIFIPCIALGLAGVGDVQAQSQPTVRLSYVRDASAADCPDEESMRRGVSFWPAFMIAGLVLLIAESLLADRMLKRPSPGHEPAPAQAHTESV